jgi:AraC-like DNA-binding protein
MIYGHDFNDLAANTVSAIGTCLCLSGPMTLTMNARSANPDLPAALDFKILAMQRVKMQRGWNFEQVISPFSHLWFVMAGHATIKHHGSAFELGPGSAYLVTPFTLHDCQGEDSLDCFQLHLLCHLPGGIELFSVMDCDRQVTERPEFRQLLERLWSICSRRDLSAAGTTSGQAQSNIAQSNTAAPLPDESGIALAHGMEAQSILRQLLQPFLTSAQVRRGSTRRSSTVSSEPFPAVQEFVNRHLAEPIELADMARVAGLHPTYFSDRFQRQMGIRPLEYLMRLRMARARYLLRISKSSIKEVTYDIGLRDPAYFSRVFVKYCHLSPSAYRITCNDSI